ncbi:histidine kinase [uncultured Tenacibaculum sp.]|uniref:sensor histidine kinase n=1 Tax=uncultured Tenacibaculum sp. TaxID=174713 RepID=UPI002626BB38|nr:histidine kinase [uncultured Tenacibaculum sp.]
MKKSDLIIKMLLKYSIHLLFWIGVYFFYTYFLGYGSINTKYVNQFSWFLMPITIASSYFFFIFLIPKFLIKKKHLEFLIYSIYTFIISFFFIIISILYGLIFSADSMITGNTIPLTKGFLFIILGVYFVIFIAITLGLVIHNYKSSQRNEELRNKFLQTQLQLKEQELKFLKMQIHPHFLFNTLNTLYGFALKKSDDAPDMILKLSGLLDYILYQIDKPSVLLKNEIEHIENYITLEKMRFQDSLDIHFYKDIECNDVKIPPMLLLPFVENAFKHGVQINGILKINASIKTNQNSLEFNIQNPIKHISSSKKGIGLENIKKRLEMLFQNNYSLNITQENNIFKVELKTTLNHV